MEGVPKIPTPEAANKNEAPASERTLTPEALEEAIDQALTLHESLKEFDNKAGEDNIVRLDRSQWQEAGMMSAQLKEVLKYIPAGECLQNGLPYHPTDEKYEYPRAVFPDRPDYPTGGNNPQPSPDGARVDQQQELVRSTT